MGESLQRRCFRREEVRNHVDTTLKNDADVPYSQKTADKKMTAADDSDIYTLAHAGGCPQCHYVYPPIWEAAPAYFEQGFVECGECKTKADLWQVVLARICTRPFLPVSALEQIGATRTGFTHIIEADKYHEIHLESVGIPGDAKILLVGYSPQGSSDGGVVFPIELHGNVPQRKIGNVLRLLGRPMVSGDGTVGTVNPVSIWVLWVHQDTKEDGWPYLMDAFEALAREEYNRVIVPAQSAVEITLMPVVRELFERHSSVEHVRSFMGDRLTFGNVINIVLPFMCSQAGVPKMPDSVRGAMNKLRQLRNDLVHSGERRASITKAESGEALGAAVFGFEYVRYLRPQLLDRLK
jgi:hypothetical protein